MSYFLEPVLILSLFGKYPLDLILYGNIIILGVTNDELDMSMDNLIYCTLPMMQKFGCNATCKILKRGFKP